MKTLYIHAGFGKCGSSSLQTFLSSYEGFYRQDGEEVVYAALLANRLLYGEALVKQASHKHAGYIASLPWVNHKIPLNDYFDQIGESLLNLLATKHVILSNEFWEHEIRFWRKIDFFQRHQIKVIFIFYIRPPVQWINSAWWQWGAWMDQSFEKWLPSAIKAINYEQKLRKFYQLEWIDQIHIRLLTPNLLTDFAKFLQLDQTIHSIPKKLTTNKSLPNSILRFYQIYRQFRPSPYASNTDFILEKYLNIEGRPDWVLTMSQVEQIMQQTHHSHKILLRWLDPDCRRIFRKDMRYWQAEAFAHLTTKPATPIKLTRKQLEQISLSAIEAIITLAQQNIGLNQDIFDQAEIWRDLAFHVEKQQPQLALSLMQQAQKLRPNAAAIEKKVALYQQQLATPI